MMKALSLAVAFGLVGMLALSGAEASPLGLVKSTSATSDVIQVRDGCGPGYRFSNRRQSCVPEGYGPGPGCREPPPRYYGEPPPRYYRERNDGAAAAAAVAAGAIALGVIASQRANRGNRVARPQGQRVRRPQ